VATETSGDEPRRGASDETTAVQEAAGTVVEIPNKRVWYRSLSEDWLATLAGLLLVVLLVIGWLHSIP